MIHNLSGLCQRRKLRKRRLELENINLPRYRCICYGNFPRCSYCAGTNTISYEVALKVWGETPMGLQTPQCHICTRFGTADNPLFAYSYFERNGEYKFIYRCQNGHGHDRAMIFLDVHTGLEKMREAKE